MTVVEGPAAVLLAALSRRDAPVLLDLGPVVGSNIAFFGERLGCKIHVEDLFADVEQHAPGRARSTCSGTTSASRPGRRQPDGSVDGILCWDVFDYLDRRGRAGRSAARLVTRAQAGRRRCYGFFGTVASSRPRTTRGS